MRHKDETALGPGEADSISTRAANEVDCGEAAFGHRARSELKGAANEHWLNACIFCRFFRLSAMRAKRLSLKIYSFSRDAKAHGTSSNFPSYKRGSNAWHRFQILVPAAA